MFYFKTLSTVEVGYTASVVDKWMGMKRWWRDNDRGKTEVLGERESCHSVTFVHHNTHAKWSGIEPETPRWEIADWPSEGLCRVLTSHWLPSDRNIKWEFAKMCETHLIFSFRFYSHWQLKMNEISFSTDLWTEDLAGTSSWVLTVTRGSCFREATQYWQSHICIMFCYLLEAGLPHCCLFCLEVGRLARSQ